MSIRKFSSLNSETSDNGKQGLDAPALSHEVTEALQSKATESKLPFEAIVEVYNRGLADWSEESQKTPDQYAFNRVNSFIAGGAARKLDEDLLMELGAGTLRRYSTAAKKDLGRISTEIDGIGHGAAHNPDVHQGFENMQKYNKLAGKYLKRVDGIKKADSKLGPKPVKEDNNAIDISGSELINEKNLGGMSRLPRISKIGNTENDRRQSIKRTKSPSVIQKHNQREKNMYHTSRAREAITVNFKTRGRNDPHLTNKHGDALTDKITSDRLSAMKKKKTKNLGESLEYLQNRKAIHDAHADAARTLAGRERHPEVRVMDLHRSKKHEAASRVIDRLIAHHKKKQKKD